MRPQATASPANPSTAPLLQGLKEEPAPKGGGRGRGRSAAAKTSSMRITPQRGSRLQQVGNQCCCWVG